LRRAPSELNQGRPDPVVSRLQSFEIGDDRGALLTILKPWECRLGAGADNRKEHHKYNFTQTLTNGIFSCLIGKAAIAADGAIEQETASFGLFSSYHKNKISPKAKQIKIIIPIYYILLFLFYRFLKKYSGYLGGEGIIRFSVRLQKQPAAEIAVDQPCKGTRHETAIAVAALVLPAVGQALPGNILPLSSTLAIEGTGASHRPLRRGRRRHQQA
jgi:hypothetical protein